MSVSLKVGVSTSKCVGKDTLFVLDGNSFLDSGNVSLRAEDRESSDCKAASLLFRRFFMNDKGDKGAEGSAVSLPEGSFHGDRSMTSLQRGSKHSSWRVLWTDLAVNSSSSSLSLSLIRSNSRCCICNSSPLLSSSCRFWTPIILCSSFAASIAASLQDVVELVRPDLFVYVFLDRGDLCDSSSARFL